ncbi:MULTISPECIES: hypothetical protein [Gammaproteobacteria]|uniref:Transmembrane protein n=1 Tax=Salinisphaera hydrothermalis (strain C41B8) TaxID=1304275 RepID=A0A084IQD9_SALHC|nr:MULTISPECIES: hypothetical protein [Gammaproteobacteria]KEZ78923.1 hypothetical protein C41B8_02297 [Salinisphaera hydrothermalis C41B8]MBO9471065.1 hypothetical protein [Endozoicomonas sp. G2_2]|tara:strand:- start:372 stop:764 length:393 start_codon:yes stop_codon:yes gene_type:complete
MHNTASERIGRIVEFRLGLPESPPLAGHAGVILNDKYRTIPKFLPAKSMENTMKLFVALLLSVLGVLVGIAPAAGQTGPGRMGDGDLMNGSMMQCGMMGGPMMIAWLLFVLLVLVVLVLAIVALIKYLRS